jgi:hypothetical protein
MARKQLSELDRLQISAQKEYERDRLRDLAAAGLTIRKQRPSRGKPLASLRKGVGCR